MCFFSPVFTEKKQGVVPEAASSKGSEEEELCDIEMWWPSPPLYFFVYINSISMSLDNSRFIRQYGNSSFSTTAKFLQFISLPRLASTNIVDNIHLEIAALLLACV